MLIPGTLPPLSNAIALVIQCGSQPEMLGVDAGADIAGMADDEIIGDRAVCQFPREPMRAVLLTVSPELAISTFEDDASPEPAATLGFLDMPPESFFDGAHLRIADAGGTAIKGHAGSLGHEGDAAVTADGGDGTIILHREPRILGAVPPVVTATRGFLASNYTTMVTR